MSTGQPSSHPSASRVSVVIPVRNGREDLRACLAAVRASSTAPHEVIVVDDGSTEEIASIVAEAGADLLRLAENHGPAFARNRGAEAARGEILFFTDADVRVHPDAIGIATRTLDADRGLCAVLGSYDETPADPHFIAQYKNLFHHWVHQHSKPEASTFWTGCGAIRRSTFLGVGGFNEGYRRPSIEDIELGFRLHARGESIRLEKSMLATHAKRWKLWDLVRTDVLLRGMPWIALMLRDRHDPKDLNLSTASKLATVFAGLFALSLPLLLAAGQLLATLPALVLLAATGSISKLAGRRSTLASGIALGLPICATALVAIAIGGWKGLVPVALLLALVSSHLDLYAFFGRKRGMPFAVAVLPMHLLFQLCCAASVPLGWIAHRSDLRRAHALAEGPAIRELPPLPRTRTMQRSLRA